MSEIKTADELVKIMKAEALGDLCFEHLLGYIKPGMREIDVADEIERFFLEHGAETLAFPTIVVSGERGSQIHGEPTEKEICEGEFVTIDMGCIYQGYCGDMTRTVAIGSYTEEMKYIYDVVLEAQLAGLAHVKAGEKCFDVDKVCREIITDAGYGEYYIHGTGHGVGREVHENPYLNTRTDEVLDSDMAVTIEPGIYIPGRLGVRIEDLAIVTEFAIINLASSPKELIVL